MVAHTLSRRNNVMPICKSQIDWVGNVWDAAFTPQGGPRCSVGPVISVNLEPYPVDITEGDALDRFFGSADLSFVLAIRAQDRGRTGSFAPGTMGILTFKAKHPSDKAALDYMVSAVVVMDVRDPETPRGLRPRRLLILDTDTE